MTLTLETNNNSMKHETMCSEQVILTKKNSTGSLLRFERQVLEPNKFHESKVAVKINSRNVMRAACNMT